MLEWLQPVFVSDPPPILKIPPNLRPSKTIPFGNFEAKLYDSPARRVASGRGGPGGLGAPAPPLMVCYHDQTQLFWGFGTLFSTNNWNIHFVFGLEHPTVFPWKCCLRTAVAAQAGWARPLPH